MSLALFDFSSADSKESHSGIHPGMGFDDKFRTKGVVNNGIPGIRTTCEMQAGLQPK